MKNKKMVVIIGTLGLITCLYAKVNAVKFYDTVDTRYEGAVERLAELGVINGVTDKAFEPNRTITRAEFAKMIVESTLTADEIKALIIDDANCTFTDIAKDKWYYYYVLAATNYGYISGYEDNTFRPDDEVTYEQVSKMLMKALGHGYLVETDPRGWSAEYMDKMYSLNIADGTTKFSKADSATRGNIAIMLWNTLTNNVWEKILLNDVAGFTYVDSGNTLFNKKVKGHVFGNDFKVNGFREIDNNLYVKIGDTYYKFYDQDTTILFSMIGGSADGLFKYVRYPQDVYKYEIIGLSTDLGSQLYSGTLDELKNDGLAINVSTTKIGSNVNYAYLLKAEEDDNDRIITMNTKDVRFYVEKIEIKENKGDTIKDDEDTVKSIEESEHDYVYIDKYQPMSKKIILNDYYEIEDGAVLFENNRRVEWNTVEEGDVITEIKKNEYYFLSRNAVEATVTACAFNKDTLKTEDIKFSTSKGEIIAYYNAACLEYYAKDGKTKLLYKLEEEALKDIEGLKVKFILDFTGRAVRIEVLEENETEEKEWGLEKMNLAYYVSFISSDDDKNNNVTLIINGKKKTYKTNLKSADAEYGELVYFELDDKNVITKIKVATAGTEVDKKVKLNKIDYDDLDEMVEKKSVTTKVPVFLTTYYYDFGEYNKVIDFEVEKTNIDVLKDINHEKSGYYVLTNDSGYIKLIIVMDYSEKKDTFYGKVEKIYTEDSKIKMEITIVGYKKMTYEVSGLLNCEENDFISFKLLNKDSIKILEKFNVSSMGYYKDIIVKDVSRKQITAENGEIYLEEGKIVTEDEEYLLSQFDIILLKLKEDSDGNLTIYNGYEVEANNIQLEKNDRIAINEIEDTVIIYRGFAQGDVL